jgi:ABC-type transport system involved in multi-copper enzyme maturation permease subunit
MIRTLALKEVLDQISSPKFVFLFAVSTVLILFSLYTGSGAYVGARSEYRATETLSRTEIENRKSWQELSQFGVKVARPPAALSAVAAGVSSALGRSARVRPENQPEIAPPPLAETPVLAVLGELDFDGVARVFLSLFVLLLTYNAVAGEKEAGTLKVVLSNPVPRAQFLLGKALGLFGVLAAATLVPALLGLLVMKVGFRIELGTAGWARLVTIAASCGLYLLAVFAVGLLVSTLTSRSSVAFLVLLLVWVAFVEVIPKASPMIAGQFRPAPTYASLQSERDRAQADFQQGMFKVMSDIFSVAQSSPGASDAEQQARQHLMDSLMARGRDSLNAELQAKTAKLDESYRNKQDAMTRLALTLSRLSPAAAMGHAVEVMGGTDFEVHRRWRDDLLAYRSQLESFLKSKGVQFGGFRVAIRTNTSTSGGRTTNQTLRIGGPGTEDARLDLASLPRFAPRPESFAAALGRAAPDLVIMGLWACAGLLLAFARFMKYDVR